MKRIEAVRRYFQKEKPSLERLQREGRATPALPWGDYLALQDVFKALKCLRKERGLSLGDLAKVSGIGKAALSRLESGLKGNPTVGTICRYAGALGARVLIAVEVGGGARRPAGLRDEGRAKPATSRRSPPRRRTSATTPRA